MSADQRDELDDLLDRYAPEPDSLPAEAEAYLSSLTDEDMTRIVQSAVARFGHLTEEERRAQIEAMQ